MDTLRQIYGKLDAVKNAQCAIFVVFFRPDLMHVAV
jgi:hypothetical protein